jgi:uncharacterized RDD family membrane protein YckC
MRNKKKYLGKRILAGIIDYSLVLISMFTMIYLFGVPNNDGGYSIEGLPAFSVFVIWFFLTIGMEQLFGATIGNILNNIKPSSITGDGLKDTISLSQSIKRHLLDLIDMSFFGLIGVILISNTENNQRLGDLWAKTKIVEV